MQCLTAHCFIAEVPTMGLNLSHFCPTVFSQNGDKLIKLLSNVQVTLVY